MAGRPVRVIAIADHPVYAMLLPIPVVCFIGALLTDLAYLNSDGNLLWANFSSWLLAAGLLFGAIAGIVLLIDVLRGIRGWWAFLLLLAAWIVELINSFVHARDGWTAVAGTGLVLSIIGALASSLIAWLPPADPAKPFPWNPITPLIENLRVMLRSRPLALAVMGIAPFCGASALLGMGFGLKAGATHRWPGS